jgi:hypothetical protein
MHVHAPAHTTACMYLLAVMTTLSAVNNEQQHD